MLNSIFITVSKLNMASQSSKLDLLTAISFVECLKLSLESLKNNEDSLKNIYNKTFEMCIDKIHHMKKTGVF